MAEKIQTILYIIYGVSIVLITVLGLFTGKVKLKKLNSSKKEIEDENSNNIDTVEKLEKTASVFDCIQSFMEQAESTGMTGAAKRMYVISMIIQKCAEVKLDYSEIADTIKEKIESLIKFSKTVNATNDEVKESKESVNTTEGTYL